MASARGSASAWRGSGRGQKVPKATGPGKGAGWIGGREGKQLGWAGPGQPCAGQTEETESVGVGSEGSG